MLDDNGQMIALKVSLVWYVALVSVVDTSGLSLPVPEPLSATMPSGTYDNCGAGEVLDLQMHTRRASPADTLASLSEACKSLGIDTFDTYGDFSKDKEESYLRQFESEVASYFGKEDGVFCLSGGMAQYIALAINARRHSPTRGDDDATQKTKAFACHPTSHLLLHENNAFSELLGMEAVVINDKPEQYNPEALNDNGCFGMEPIRLSQVKDLFSSLDDSVSLPSATTTSLTYPNLKPIESAEISTLILELPHRELGGKLTPWEEVVGISRMCKERGIRYHCDGARVFEASVGYGHKSVKETAEPFSSVYISFYKGIGAISGAMLLGDSNFCAEARVWLRRMGGNLFSVLPYAVSSWDGFHRYCLAEEANTSMDSKDGSVPIKLVYDPKIFEARRQKLARVLGLLQEETAISSIVQFDPVVPEVNIVHGYLRMSCDECMTTLESVEKNTGIRVLSRVRKCNNDNSSDANNQEFGCRFEMTMGKSNSLIEDEQFLFGWRAIATAVKGNQDKYSYQF